MKATGNDDLTDLLNEAKHTILELQHEIQSLKSEIEQLRQQNQTNNKPVIDSGRVEMESKSTPISVPASVSAVQAQRESPAAMPLEPVVIVNGNRKATENPNAKVESKNAHERMPSDQTSQSDNTFVV